MTVRSRFAPSPTGFLHIGSVRTALYAWLFARHHGGEFVLRIEDTDRARSTKAAVDAIIDGLAWVGLDADEGPIFQTTRFDRYREVAGRLLAEGKAYHCYCTPAELDAMRAAAQAEGRKPRYNGRCRGGDRRVAGVTPVIRFKNPLDGQVILDDLVKGRIIFDNAELDDLVIMRGDGTPTYNFAVVVDDLDMSISHVIRGDDHVNNTPRQINLFLALGARPPAFGHLSMIHGADGTKLSKRHGAVNILEYREAGFLPDAVLNYLARLGWSHGNQEIFSRDELIQFFDLDHVNRAAATFDAAKLLWVNQQHLVRSPPESVAPLLGEFLGKAGLSVAAGPPLDIAVTALRERARTLEEMASQAHPYYADFHSFDPKAATAHLTGASRAALAAVREAFAALPEWTEASTQRAVETVAAMLGAKLGKVAQPLRVALSGTSASPGIGTTCVLVGRARALARIDRALAEIDGQGTKPQAVS